MLFTLRTIHIAWAQCITLLLNLEVHVLYLTLDCQGFNTVIGRPVIHCNGAATFPLSLPPHTSFQQLWRLWQPPPLPLRSM